MVLGLLHLLFKHNVFICDMLCTSRSCQQMRRPLSLSTLRLLLTFADSKHVFCLSKCRSRFLPGGIGLLCSLFMRLHSLFAFPHL